MSRLLIISPHLDDAVLSCGAYLTKAAAEGNEVLAATVFSSAGPGSRKGLQALYQQRTFDDSKAMGLLGVGYQHLGFADAPFRNRIYHNFSSILFHHQLPPFETEQVEAIARRIKELISDWKPDQLLFPLGVGGHIDHHLVWEASKSFWNGAYSLAYYEELPYSFLPGWATVRWQKLGGASLPGERQSKVTKMPLSGSPYHFVHNYMSNEDDWRSSRDKYDAEFRKSIPHPFQWEIHGRIFDCLIREPDDICLETKSQAIFAYTTEWPGLFGPDQYNILKTLKQAPVKETSWVLKP